MPFLSNEDLTHSTHDQTNGNYGMGPIDEFQGKGFEAVSGEVSKVQTTWFTYFYLSREMKLF